jgi:hypothetical protein
VTWAFFEMNPLGLIFAALALFWFGSDLVRLWGPVRFLATYLGIAAAAAGCDLPPGARLVSARGPRSGRSLAGDLGPDHRLGDRLPDARHLRLLRAAPARAET